MTVMPPGDYTVSGKIGLRVAHVQNVGKKDQHWSLPVVTRFNHSNGIAPYNGIIAVTANSRALSQAEHKADREYGTVQQKCERVAELCRATAPIRVDVRRKTPGGPFILFDVNMKPVGND